MNTLQRLAHALMIGLLIGSMTVVPRAASAQTTATRVVGTIVSQDGGLGIGGATVVLSQGANTVATTTTDAAGNFSFANVTPGEYSITIRATGYAQTRIDSVVAVNGSAATVRTPLRRAQTSTGGLTQIGRTSATNRASSLASTATIQYNLDPEQIQSQGFLKAGDAIAQQPGVNLVGGPHTVGDDTFIDIRGLGQFEVRPLVDGHPIGPLGVYSTDSYNYNNTAFGLLDNINVTIGSGATGLYGVDVIGGTIDFQTLSPTTRPHADLLQTFGNDGTAESLAKTTGSIGRFGYAFGHSVTGTFGPLSPGQVIQGSRPNNNSNLPNNGACTGSNDVTSCNTLLNTYAVSANYKVLNDLAKLRYNFTPTTALTVTAYDGNVHADSTGNGDNDNIPYVTRLAQLNASKPTCANGVGFAVITNAGPTCYTAAQYAAVSYGPFGGGADRNRGTSLQDFSGRLTSSLGINNFSVAAFSDYYNFHKYSAGASGYDPRGSFLIGGGTYQNNYLTHGFLVTDDIAIANNDVGFGYFIEHQQTSGDNRVYNSTANTVSFVPNNIYGEGDYSFFLRDNYTPSKQLAVYFNAWDRRSSVTQHTTVDPRISFVVRPTSRDILRFTAGQADGDPAVNTVQAAAINGVNNPNSLNPSCTQFNSVASAGNADLRPERSSDLEAAIGHRFWDDTAVNVVGYVSSVKDQIISGVGPITAIALANPAISSQLAQFAAKINSQCPGFNLSAATVSSVLGLSEYVNATSGLVRGIEATERIRVAPWIRFDGVYDIQSSRQFGQPVAFLQANPFALDGGQAYAIPVHKFSVAADYTGVRGYEAQLELYYIGNNNTLNRPAYTYYNGFLSKSFSKNLSLTLSGYNLFDQNSSNYGYFGLQYPAPTNQYYTGDSSALGQATGIALGTQEELFGLQPRLITVQLNARI